MPFVDDNIAFAAVLPNKLGVAAAEGGPRGALLPGPAQEGRLEPQLRT